MAELHETIMGKKLLEHTLPEIAKQLERIADILDMNKIKKLIRLHPNDQELGRQVRKYTEIVQDDDLENSISIQGLIDFLEYEEAVTKDKETASRIRNLLTNLGLWKN